MAQRIRLNIEEIEKYYRIEEDGMVWSYKKNGYLHPTKSNSYYSYYYVCLKDAGMTWVSVHKLVAGKYLGSCPDGKEISHKDGNKWNNHWSNLEYLTHKENIRKSFDEHGRIFEKRDYLPLSVEHKIKLAQSRMKPVYCSDGRSWRSIEECAGVIGKNRNTVWLSIHQGREIIGVGGMLGFCSPVPPPRPKSPKKAGDYRRKPVYCSDGRSWPSVTGCAGAIGKSREAIWMSIRQGKELKGVGGVLSFCSPANK